VVRHVQVSERASGKEQEQRFAHTIVIAVAIVLRVSLRLGRSVLALLVLVVLRMRKIYNPCHRYYYRNT